MRISKAQLDIHLKERKIRMGDLESLIKKGREHCEKDDEMRNRDARDELKHLMRGFFDRETANQI